MSATLEIRRQYGPSEGAQPPRVEWRIDETLEVRGQKSEHFVAYSMSYTGAQQAIEEIKNSVARLDARMLTGCRLLGVGCRAPLTQTTIDGNPLGNAARRPLGALRQIFWKAARAQ